MVDAQFGGIKKDTLKVIKSIPQRVCEKAKGKAQKREPTKRQILQTLKQKEKV